jgi:hypothetical protein
VQFFLDMERVDMSMIDLLKTVDATFERSEDRLETAINAKGFEVDFIRRVAVSDDLHPVRFTDHEDDLWPIQVARASVLTSSPKFSQVVISSTGRMATMTTIDPVVFVEFKKWMAAKAPNRANQKKRRDLLQANIVDELITERILVSAMTNIADQAALEDPDLSANAP